MGWYRIICIMVQKKFSMEYEYGYVYGGLFVVGYCHFIHAYYEQHHLDQVLFLARDGDILRRVYQKLYPDDRTVYVYWSRKAATKLMADEDKHDFFPKVYLSQGEPKGFYRGRIAFYGTGEVDPGAFGLAGNLDGMEKEKRHERETKVY